MSRPAHRLALVALVGAVVVTAAPGRAALGHAAARPGGHHHLPTERITFGEQTCAPRWYAPNKGRNRFRIENRSHHRATVYLVRLPAGRTVARLTGSRPGTTRSLRVRLRPGSYLWGCYLAGLPPHVSEAEKVPIDDTHGGPGAPVVPVSRTDLAGPYRSYRRYVAEHLALLQTQVQDLVSALGSHDAGAAKQAWLTARLTWLRLGQDNSAYGAFGKLGRRIDGTAAGLPHGTSDPGFTGFHRVELDLWPASGIAPDLDAAAADAAHLQVLVARLAARPLVDWLPASKAGETSWILRVHEVLEDALRDSLSGEDDDGSGTTLASITADVAATREDLSLLEHLVTARAPHLVPRARHRLNHLMSVVRGLRGVDGWPPLGSLTLHQRQAVDAATDAALEVLAPIPDLLPIGTHT